MVVFSMTLVNITKVPPTTVKDTHFYCVVVARTTDKTILY